MFKVNENYLKLPGSYLFSNIGKKVAAYKEANPDKSIISLGIGDVTQPLAPEIIKSLHSAVDEMGKAETFHGYAPDLGYEFLRNAIADGDYKSRGCDISADEIFVSDGAKCDSGNIQEIFSVDNKIAVCDPVYPVYVDTNVMAGRTGTYNPTTETWSDVIYMPCTKETNFAPELPKETPDIIYLCFPNNPTGSAYTKEQLEEWVAYALKNDAVILYDAAYEAYVTDPAIPRSIFVIEDAKKCAIELCSLSKTAGFTGTRCGYTVVPHALVRKTESGKEMELNKMWLRRQTTKFNGVPYIIQRGAEAVFSEEGIKQCRESIAYYQENARIIMEGFDKVGIKYYGGVHSPYIWLQCPNGMSSWEFFDFLLEKLQVVGTPGAGFGKMGEGFFRLTAFGSRENTIEAMERIINGLKK